MNLPIHPMMVHFPVALYLLEILLIAFWIFKKDAVYRRFALFVFRAAFLGMIASAVTGWLDAGGWNNIEGKTAAHFYGALTLGALQLGRFFYWHLGKPSGDKGARICLLTALAACAALMYTAYHGGELVYGTE